MIRAWTLPRHGDLDEAESLVSPDQPAADLADLALHAARLGDVARATRFEPRRPNRCPAGSPTWWRWSRSGRLARRIAEQAVAALPAQSGLVHEAKYVLTRAAEALGRPDLTAQILQTIDETYTPTNRLAAAARRVRTVSAPPRALTPSDPLTRSRKNSSKTSGR